MVGRGGVGVDSYVYLLSLFRYQRSLFPGVKICSSKNPIGLAILNLNVVQGIRKTRVSELSVISSEERDFKN